jgi:hypothetical protein
MPNKKDFPICNRCRLPIEDPAYVYIQPALLLQHFYAQVPPLFSCPEHAANFAQKMVFHDDCWMDELRDHGALTHDMKEVKKHYAKEALEKIVNESNSSSSCSSSSNNSESKEAN